MATEDNPDEANTVSAADVCLHGIDIIMPLMTLELLRFPTLCQAYFRTVTLLAEIYPEKICDLGPGLLKNLVTSLELGLSATVGGDTVLQLCCDFVQVRKGGTSNCYCGLPLVALLQVLCSYMVRSRKCHQVPLYEALRPFLKV